MISLTAIQDLMFDRFEVSRVLVVAPLRVARTVWPQEQRTWDHLSLLRLSVLVGTEKQRIAALEADADVYVINRENMKWLLDELSARHIPWPFDMVVIDELSSFKNHQSQRWRALRKVRPRIRRIVGLTGTPAGNGLMDLWAETWLIDQGARLESFISRYRDIFFRPIGMNPYTGVVYNYVPREGAEEEIYRRLSDITVSMKARDYLSMPDCISVRHEAALSPTEQKLYETMKEDLLVRLREQLRQEAEIQAVSGSKIPAANRLEMCDVSDPSVRVSAANAAALSGKLLQMANGAVYSDAGGAMILHNRKLEILQDLIEQANGQSVLIAYWFQHDRLRLHSFLEDLGFIPRDLKSDQDIMDWNAGKIRVALINPASAGHGLNIQKGGHILIWFSLCWSLELYQQTNARLWRQGQKEVVTIHHIVTKNTIDEDVLAALKSKDLTQQSLINAVKAHLERGDGSSVPERGDGSSVLRPETRNVQSR